jgi:hypothetical protein
VLVQLGACLTGDFLTFKLDVQVERAFWVKEGGLWTGCYIEDSRMFGFC